MPANFFELPLDIAIEVNSHLAPNDLYHQGRLVDKRQYLVASLALLSKQTANAIPFQENLLRDWTHNLPTFVQAYSDKLSATLTRLLTNPFLSLESKLQALMILGTIKNINLAPTQEFIQQLVDDLKNTDTSHQAVLKGLTAYAPRLPKEDIDIFISSINNELKDDRYKVCQAAMQCLKAFAPYISQKIFTVLTYNAREQLNNENEVIRLAALQYFIACAPRLPKNQPIIVNVYEKLKDKSEKVYQAASQCFKVLMPHVLPNVVTYLTNKFIAELDGVFRLKALECLTVCAPYSKDNINEVVISVRNKLNDQEDEVRQAAIYCLAACAPHLPPATLTTLITDFSEKINPESTEQDCEMALKCLTYFTKYISSETLSIFTTTKISNLLSHDNNDISLAALNYLIACIPYLPNTVLNTLTAKVSTQLYHTETEVRRAALSCLFAFAPHISLEALNLFISLVNNLQHNDANEQIRQAALRCLIACATRLPNILSQLINNFKTLLKNEIKSEESNDDHYIALTSLTTLVSYLPLEELKQLVPMVLTQLKNEDWVIPTRYAAFDFLTTCALYTEFKLDDNNLLLDTINRQVKNKQSEVCYAALKYSLVVGLSLSQEMLTQILSSTNNLTDYRDFYIFINRLISQKPLTSHSTFEYLNQVDALNNSFLNLFIENIKRVFEKKNSDNTHQDRKRQILTNDDNCDSSKRLKA